MPSAFLSHYDPQQLSGSGRADIDGMMARLLAQRRARFTHGPQGDPEMTGAETPPASVDPRIAEAVSTQFGPEAAAKFDAIRQRRATPPNGPVAALPAKGGGVAGELSPDLPYEAPQSDPLGVVAATQSRGPGTATRGPQDLSGVTTTADGRQVITGRGGREQEIGAAGRRRLPPPPATPAGLLTADQYDNNHDYDWFRNGEGAAGRGTDVNAFNEWFHQNGREFGEADWDRLYGSPATPPSGPPVDRRQLPPGVGGRPRNPTPGGGAVGGGGAGRVAGSRGIGGVMGPAGPSAAKDPATDERPSGTIGSDGTAPPAAPTGPSLNPKGTAQTARRRQPFIGRPLGRPRF